MTNLIEKSDNTYRKLKELGLSEQRPREPDAKWLEGRYHYNPFTGEIRGPSGKVLKPVVNGRYGTVRVGVFYKKKTVAVTVGRLAFALQHGRWPVGIGYRNSDLADNAAENLYEVSSRKLNEALQAQRNVEGWKKRHSTALAVVAKHTPQEMRRIRRGNILGELARIKSALETAKLSPSDRNTLRRAERALEGLWRDLSRKMETDPQGALSDASKPAPAVRLTKPNRRGVVTVNNWPKRPKPIDPRKLVSRSKKGR